MKRSFFFPSLIGMVSLLAISSIGATYAWYQYQTFVTVGFGGTSIDATKIFEVGLVSEVPLDTEHHDFTFEQVGDKKIYWINGTATRNLTTYYLEQNGYGTTQLFGVSSGKYESGHLYTDGLDGFELKRAPTCGNNYYDSNTGYLNAADKESYLHFELAFRLSVLSSDGQAAVETSGVKLSNVEFINYDNDLHNAVRVHFCDVNNAKRGFIFNPTEEEDGYDNVGGPLDLSSNGAFDIYSRGNAEYEIPYGQFDELVYKDEITSDGWDKGRADTDDNSFTAEHLNGAYAIDMEKSKPSTSEYFGKKSVIENNKIIATPGELGLAFFNMDIYLEGWDKDFTNKNLDKTFQCNLEFESI